jgi:two-component system nitrogen regulation sensor histidine kinase NtrY
MTEPGKETPLTPELSRRKRIFERGLIILAVLSLVLLIIVQRELLNLGPGLSSNQGVITLVSINMSVFILGLLLFLILRGLYRIFFERRDYGSLQTKMVVSFISLSLMPTLMIFYFSYLLIGQDQETWFSSSIQKTFDDSRSLAGLAQELDLALTAANVGVFSAALRARLEGPGARTGGPAGDALDPAALGSPGFAEFLDAGRRGLGWSSLEIYDAAGVVLARSGEVAGLAPVPADFLATVPAVPGPGSLRAWPPAGGPEARGGPGEAPGGRLVSAADAGGGGAVFLAVAGPGHAAVMAGARDVEDGLAKYRAALGISRPFRVTQMTSLAGVTLLAVFLSIWIGSHLAGSLAGPVTELVEGTRRVAKGDLDFVLTPARKSGETAQLVQAFNQMTAELRESYTEIDRRRRFVETVLKQVSSGVLVLDLELRLVNFNQAARAMLELEDRDVQEAGPERIRPLLAGGSGAKGRSRDHVFLEIDDRVLSLSVTRTKLRDEEGREIGSLITFDDISELEKAQRLAAWREVAKRIAHEVKNPLTPISLSAQRLSRRFGQLPESPEDRAVFEECASVIVRQVENMRQLVDEFSQFARLPEINPKPADFVKVVSENVALFRSAHPEMEFGLEVGKAPGVFVFDPVQIGRVVTNLLANAAAATKGRGRVDLAVGLDDLTGVSLSIADNGPGLRPEVRDRVFEPYVSSGKGEGRGLGLAIVNAIVRDHEGFIRVSDNQPTGTVFRVTLPYRRN